MGKIQPLAVNTLGQIGLPAPIQELAAKTWDAIIVGAGHNGLTCAAYLAREGKKVLVVEGNDRVGGANTLEEVYPGVRMSPCAYVVGLLHPLVQNELKMKEHGFRWIPATGGSFVPFEDGTSLQLSYDDTKCEAEVQAFAPEDFKGWKAMSELKRQVRDALRPEGKGDVWIGNSPSRDEIEKRLRFRPEARKLVFEWSMVEFLETFLTNEKLQMAYLGQGVIGTNATPQTPGTAYVNFHHACGRMDGLAGTWGYVVGGMGMISFIISDIARSFGAVIATGVPVSEIIPGEGVRLAGGEKLSSPIVISNADPKATLRLLGNRADSHWRQSVDMISMKGCTVKVNLVLRELPNFISRPGILEPHHYGQINTPLSKMEFQTSFEQAKQGELPEKLWTEIYLHTPHDPSVAPPGIHTMSVFSQYVPYAFAKGTWDEHREKVGDKVVQTIAQYCSNLPQALLHREVLGPPDVESKLGMTGGHIFHGEILPSNMWDKRLTAKTPMPGVYLCGAGIHPGGSVIGINGRNAAMEVLGRN